MGFVLLADEYRGESQSAEISRSPMQLVNGDEYIGRGNAQNSIRLTNTKFIESSDKQGSPTAHGTGSNETEDYVKRFLFTLFPDLKGKDAHWFVKLITDDVVKEIKKQNEEERRKHD